MNERWKIIELSFYRAIIFDGDIQATNFGKKREELREFGQGFDAYGQFFQIRAGNSGQIHITRLESHRLPTTIVGV